MMDDDQTSMISELADGTTAGDVDLPLLASAPDDPSQYDVWMGILSSSQVRYFGRIVTMEAVGAVHVDHEGNIAKST